MSEVLKEIASYGMIPVLSIDKASRAVPLARALQKGGLPLMEVMFRTDAAAESIRLIAQNVPGFTVGAGTVLTVEQAERAIAAGAVFLVAPGFNPRVCEYAISRNVPIVPGCVSPSEVDAARCLGLKVLKFFPAVQNGGVGAMKLLSGPYPDITFVPTGDLDRPLAYEYLSFRRVDAAGGDFMLKYEDIYADNYAKIERDVSETVSDYLRLRLRRVEIGGAGAEARPSLFPELLAFSGEPGSTVELSTRDLPRACWHFKRRGAVFEEESAQYAADGTLSAIRFKDSRGGLRVYLVQEE